MLSADLLIQQGTPTSKDWQGQGSNSFLWVRQPWTGEGGIGGPAHSSPRELQEVWEGKGLDTLGEAGPV